MKALQSNRLSMMLMAGSLLLLLLFLCFWLNSVYRDTYGALQKDTDYLFSESIRSIEDQLLQEIYGAPFSFTSSDSSGSSLIKVKLDHQFDTLSAVAFMGDEYKEFRSDSTYKLTIRSKKISGQDQHIFGSIGLAALLKKDSAGINREALKDDAEILASLQDRVADAIQKAKIPLDYQITRLDTVPSHQQNALFSTYTDLFSGRTYALQYDGYQWYLVKKMLPEILFSLFLFSMIAVAFYLVYRSLQQQRKLAQLKNDFVSNITHELKTPITTVRVAIEALSDFDALREPARTKEYLDISKHELDRLSILVDKVLKLSLFEKREPELKIETFNMNKLIQSILETMKLQFEKFNAIVRFEPLDQAVNLSGDKIHLTSVLYNLIDNALKYSINRPEIDIRLSQSDQHIKLSIADKGIGIASEHKDRIFEKFFRVPTGDQHNIKGYGLGLSYVASVIQKHHGQVAVESSPNRGTNFTIQLPKQYEQD